MLTDNICHSDEKNCFPRNEKEPLSLQLLQLLTNTIIMKRFGLLSVLFVTIILNGCVVKSLHPFYTSDDVVFMPDLLGKWLDQDSSVWIIEQQADPVGFLKGGFENLLTDSYTIKLGEPLSVFEGTLFKLKDIYYLDFFPIMSEHFDDEFYSFHLLPTHSLARVDFLDKGLVKISWFNEIWLAGLFEQNKVKISHEKVKISGNEEVYVLTASTKELQKFIVKYGDNPEIYQCDDDGICVTIMKINE